MGDLQARYEVSARRACEVVGIGRSSFYYESCADRQEELRLRIRDIAEARVHYGYRRILTALRREGWMVNHKRVYRLYTQDCLTFLRKKPRRHVSCQKRVERIVPVCPDQVWAMDFMADQLYDGRRFRILTLMDTHTRECLALHVGQNITGYDVAKVLDGVLLTRSAPERICVDNGSEFTSKVLDQWAYLRGVQLSFSRPGKPTDNSLIESFNGRLRAECLNGHWFLNLRDAARIIGQWRTDYNDNRPHSSLGDRTPSQFRSECESSSCDSPEMPEETRSGLALAPVG